jgi:hypothetical protein
MKMRMMTMKVFYKKCMQKHKTVKVRGVEVKLFFFLLIIIIKERKKQRLKIIIIKVFEDIPTKQQQRRQITSLNMNISFIHHLTTLHFHDI